MSALRAWAVFFFFCTLVLGIVGVIGVMQVRLQGNIVGQSIREIEKNTDACRKELAYIERERSKAQDALSLGRRVSEELRQPESSQVIWIRAVLVQPAAKTIQSPRLAALDSAVRNPVDQGGGVQR